MTLRGLITVVEMQEVARQYREAWRDCIDKIDSEASHRENWDGSDHNLHAFDSLMDAIMALPVPIGAELFRASLSDGEFSTDGEKR